MDRSDYASIFLLLIVVLGLWKGPEYWRKLSTDPAAERRRDLCEYFSRWSVIPKSDVPTCISNEFLFIDAADRASKHMAENEVVRLLEIRDDLDELKKGVRVDVFDAVGEMGLEHIRDRGHRLHLDASAIEETRRLLDLRYIDVENLGLLYSDVHNSPDQDVPQFMLDIELGLLTYIDGLGAWTKISDHLTYLCGALPKYSPCGGRVYLRMIEAGLFTEVVAVHLDLHLPDRSVLKRRLEENYRDRWSDVDLGRLASDHAKMSLRQYFGPQ